jgi:hypothetical protein
MALGEYEERPRPNLQGVIQKLRETSKAYKHILVVGKIMDEDMRKNKKQVDPIRNFYENIIDPEEDQENPKTKSFSQRVNGICVLAQQLYVHLMECEEDRFLDIVMENLRDSVGKQIHEQVWVLHFTEEEPERCMSFWQIHSINTSSAAHEIKQMTQFGKVCDIYDHITKLGRDLEKLARSGKDDKQRENAIQKYAAD